MSNEMNIGNAGWQETKALLAGKSVSALRALYRAARSACLASEAWKNASAKDFDMHVERQVNNDLSFGRACPCTREELFVQKAFLQLVQCFSVTHHVKPSEESLNWGEFLGGSFYTDKKVALRRAQAVFASV